VLIVVAQVILLPTLLVLSDWEAIADVDTSGLADWQGGAACFSAHSRPGCSRDDVGLQCPFPLKRQAS